MTEKTAITGKFSLRVFNKDGKVIERYESSNLVVNSGRDSASRLVGGSGANKQITQFAVGESSAAPSPTDADLSNKFIKAIDSVSYPQTGAAAFNWSLDFAEANGLDIYEFGLFNAGNELFSRKTRSLISKTADIRIEGTWTIQF